LSAMSQRERDQLRDQLSTRQREVERQRTELLRDPANRDPRVQEARQEHQRLDQESQRLWREYNDARHQIYEREQSLGNRVGRVFGRDSVDTIQDRETREQRDLAHAASARASEAQARMRELER